MTIPDGMVPWGGGDSAPVDWNGGPVKCRSGSWWDGHCRWWHIPGPSDIIAYTPRAAADRQPEQLSAHTGQLEKVGNPNHSAEQPSMVLVPRVATEAQWGGLARAIMMWLDMEPKTPRALFRHLKASGREIPQWLRDEPEMQALDHVPSKGTRCVLIYRAMIAAALAPASGEEG